MRIFTKNLRTLLFIVLVVLTGRFSAQVGPPDLRCISVVNTTDIALTWIAPPDPANQFLRYEIYTSALQAGPYSLAGTVNTLAQTNFTHVGGNGNIQAKYYYIVTVSNGPVSSTPSDTLRSVFLNLVNALNGIADMSWNATHMPLLPTASTTYTLSREYPVGTWTTIYTGPALRYKDTLSICTVTYNYKLETSDELGCVSVSNIPGSTFSDFTSPHQAFFDSVSVNAAGLATLGWEPSTSPDAVGYVAYKFLGGVWTAIGTISGINNTTFTYAGSTASSGPEEFRLAVIDSCNNITPLGIIHKSIYVSGQYDICQRSAKLTWNKYGNMPNGVQSYSVYCSRNGSAPFLVGTTTAGDTDLVHTGLIPDTVYCYTVRARNNNGAITALSNKTCITATGANGPSFIYIRSVSVVPDQSIEVTYHVDNSKPYKGVRVYKSDDGVNFRYIGTNTNTLSTTYADSDVNTGKLNYYYKLYVNDTCGNEAAQSNVSRSMVLHVVHDNESFFNNILSWDAYSAWPGGVESYNIYRSVNGVFGPLPVANVPVGSSRYSDNVSDYADQSGKFGYYVEAVEAPGNPYGFKDVARSNISEAYVEVNVFVPNAFAPQGHNAKWMPVAQYVDKTDYKVMVFNRWGNKIFETSSDTEGWDGSGATDDVYAYLIQYKNARGEFVELKGTFFLMR